MAVVFDLLSNILACAYAGIDHDAPLDINRQCVVPGEIVWDNCQCGQLVIAESRRFPSNAFPLEQVDHTAECGAAWLVLDAKLNLTRCAPAIDVNGNPPKCVDLTASAKQLSKDMTDIRQAVECCLDGMYNANQIIAYELGAQEIVGPEGGCVGSELTIFIGVPNGCGCG